MKFYLRGIIAFALLSGTWAKAQTIQSPYSIYGLGEILFQGLPQNYAMGGVGIGTPNPWHINLQNPAQLVYNGFSTFQTGINGDFRRYRTTLDNTKDQTASLRYLAMSFPVVRNRWTASFAMLPLSNVKYNTFTQDSLDVGEKSITQFQGSGGLSQLIWANGFKIYKSLSFGVKGAYLFGSINRNSRVQLIGDSYGSNYAINYANKTFYSDFIFSLSMAYKWNLSEKSFLNFGATYDLRKTLEGSKTNEFQRLSLSGTKLQTVTLDNSSLVGITMPGALGLGMSYEVLNILRLGFDIKKENWRSDNESSTVSLRNITNLAFGAEYTPDYKSVNSYIKRISYRGGIAMRQLPYLVNNTEINDFGINFGASFPVSGLSSLDLAFKVGQRGTTNNNLIKEKYFRVILGATINDRWFIKRRYD